MILVMENSGDGVTVNPNSPDRELGTKYNPIGLILCIRISGLVEVPTSIQESLFRIRLHKKYTATLLEPTEANKKLLLKIRNFVAYGPINKETLVELLKKRGMPMENKKKIDAEKIAEQVGKKPLQDLGVKPYFRLHPPRGGIDSKVHYPIRKGVLGDNKEDINELVRRML